MSFGGWPDRGRCQRGAAPRSRWRWSSPWWVRMVRGGLATQDLRKPDQGACASVRRGGGRVVHQRGRRPVLMSTILILSLPSFSPSLERARASRPAAARHDALLDGNSSFPTTYPAPSWSASARAAGKDARDCGRRLTRQLHFTSRLGVWSEEKDGRHEWLRQVGFRARSGIA